MAEELSLESEVSHRVTRRAARALARAWRQAGGGRIRMARPDRHNSGPRIKLGLGSLVRPSVVVQFDVPYQSEMAAAADRLALTTAAWDSLGDFEAWRALSAPLATIPRLGRPDWSRPWVATLGGGGRRAEQAAAGLAQLQVIGGWRPPSLGAVWWPSWPGAVAAVLGRAAYVLGENDPFVYDAIRAGVPLGPTQGSAVDTPPDLGGALAGLVPPSLLGEPRLWWHVAQTARAVHETGRAPLPLMTPEWVRLGRDRIREQLAAPPSGWERLQRRHDKLRRDPRRFFADSRFAPLRAFGRVMLPRR